MQVSWSQNQPSHAKLSSPLQGTGQLLTPDADKNTWQMKACPPASKASRSDCSCTEYSFWGQERISFPPSFGKLGSAPFEQLIKVNAATRSKATGS